MVRGGQVIKDTTVTKPFTVKEILSKQFTVTVEKDGKPTTMFCDLPRNSKNGAHTFRIEGARLVKRLDWIKERGTDNRGVEDITEDWIENTYDFTA